MPSLFRLYTSWISKQPYGVFSTWLVATRSSNHATAISLENYQADILDICNQLQAMAANVCLHNKQ